MSSSAITDAPTDVEGLHRYAKVQRITWTIQRFGWWLLLAFILASLAGLFGEGPLANSVAAGPQGSVRYETILRREAETKLLFDIRNRAGTATLTLPASYVDAVEITTVVPEPADTIATGDMLSFRFNARGRTAHVSLTVRPKHPGPLSFKPYANDESIPAKDPFVLP